MTTQPQETALTTRNQQLMQVRDGMEVGASRPLPIVPTNFVQVQAMCSALTLSDLVPKAYKDKPQDMAIVIMSGAELGIAPMAALRSYHLIEGVPRLSSEGVRGLILSSPLCEYLEFIESTETRATWVGKRRGRPEKSVTWTIERAKRAGLIKTNRDGGPGMWMKFPENMLLARAGAELCRLVWPDVMAGLLTLEEANDGMPDASSPIINVTPGPLPDVARPAQVQVAAAEPAKPATAAAKPRAAAKPIDAKSTEVPTSRPTSGDSSSGATSAPAPSVTSSTAAPAASTAAPFPGSVPADVREELAKSRPTSPAPTSSSASTASESSPAATPHGAGGDDFYEDDPRDATPPPKTLADYYTWVSSCATEADLRRGKAGWRAWAQTDESGIASGSPEAAAMQQAYAKRMTELTK